MMGERDGEQRDGERVRVYLQRAWKKRKGRPTGTETKKGMREEGKGKGRECKREKREEDGK